MLEYSILLVDDEEDVLNALKRLFRSRKDIKVYTAGDAKTGVKLLGQNQIDLVISDQKMPGVEGHQFLGYLKEHFPDVVRIILSGYAEQDTMMAAINRGEVYRYITKPWDNKDLLVTVEKALEHGVLARENKQLNEELLIKNARLEEMNRTLEEKVKQRTEKLEKALDVIRRQRDSAQNGLKDTATFLTSIVGMIRKDISEHIRRTADLVQMVVLELKLPANEARLIIMAAYFHEIGRISNSRSDGEGEEEPGSSPELSEHLIRSVLKLADLAHIVRHYRENINGSGSPDQLAGEDIPLGSRIIRVCKDGDHLLNERGLSVQQAGTFLLQHKEDLYDEKIIRAFLNILEPGDENTDKVRMKDLKPGMVLSGNLYLENGVLFLPSGTEVTEEIIQRIDDFSDLLDPDLEIYIKSISV